VSYPSSSWVLNRKRQKLGRGIPREAGGIIIPLVSGTGIDLAARPATGSCCFIWTAALLLLPCPTAPGQLATETSLRHLFAKLPDPAAVAGVAVIDLGTGNPVFLHNADRPLIPASTMKVFVMAAGITELGENFTFETSLAMSGSDLILIGDGDPAFGDEKVHRGRGESITADLERWADVLLGQGTRAVQNLVLDESIFDEQRLHPSWEPADLDNWFAAPVGALNFNDNCVDITLTPAKKPNMPVLVSVRPEASLIEVLNRCKSGGKGDPVLRHLPASFQYVVSGRCNKPWALSPVTFPDPGLLFADAFRQVLIRKGIRVDGEIRRGRVRLPDGSIPASITILDRKQTPLADVLRRIGKDSQNLFAECLLKRTGYPWAKHHGQPDPQGTWASGASAIRETVRRAGIDADSFVAADGSGLSRDNRCTARQLAAVLCWMHRQPGAALFRESLSVAGVDGSLRKRLKDVRGQVYSKTGTMRGVRALAGFVYAPDGRAYAFAAIFNGYKGGSAPYKEIQDRLCRTLAGASPPQRTK